LVVASNTDFTENKVLHADASLIMDADGIGIVSWQWQRSGDGGVTWTDISGATSSSYTLGDSDAGNRVRTRGSYTDGQGTVETLYSVASTRVFSVNYTPTGFGVSILGSTTEDATLTASAGVTSDTNGLPSPLIFSYQWQSSSNGSTWSNIANATSADFTPSDAQVGLKLRVITSYTDGQGTVETTISTTTAAITNVNDAPVASSVIGSQIAVLGQAYSLDLRSYFTDPDSGNASGLTFTLADGSLPTGLTLSNGVISGTALALSELRSVTVSATDANGLNVKQSFSISALSQPTLKANALDGVTNLDVRSNLVFEFTEAVTAVAGKTIKIVNDANSGTKLGYAGESLTNTFVLDVTDPSVTVSGSKVTINLGRDLDLSNNYHVKIDAGAFVGVTSKLASLGVSDPTTLNFSTVTPDTDQLITSTTGLSQIIQADGSLADSFIWKDMEGWGKDGSLATLDLTVSSIALVTADLLAATSTLNPAATNVETGNFYLALQNFGANDVIYMDDLGRNTDNLSQTLNLIFGIQVRSDGSNTSFNFASSNNGGHIDILGHVFSTPGEWQNILQNNNSGFVLG